MTVSYVTAKVKEALDATENNKQAAQKLLVTWAVRDQQLLLGFSKPYLKGLVADKISEILGKQKKASNNLSKDDIENIVQEYGAKSERRQYSKIPPPNFSAHQSSMVHKIAAAFKKKF